MKNLSTPLFIIAFGLISCKNESEKQPPKVVVPFYQVANQQQNQTLKTPQTNQGQSLYPAASAQNTATQMQTTAAVKVAKGMNPSHGQPGHRCDIAVGAPLNSAVVANSTTAKAVSSSGQTVTTTSAATTNTTTAKGMNPPHGQAGHRCDIPVGSPLNTPVATDKAGSPPATPNYIVSPTSTSDTPAAAAAETITPSKTSGQ